MRCFISLFLSLVLFTVSSGIANASRLLELYENATDYDATVESKTYEYRAVKERDNQAFAKMLPSANFTGRFSYYDTNIYGNYNTKDYGIGIKTPIFHLGNIYELKQSKSIIKASKSQLEDVKQNLILRVSEKYINSIFAHQNIQINESAYKAVYEQFVQSEKYYKSGLSSKTELYEVKAELQQKEYEIEKSRNNFKNSLVQLETVTGVMPQELYCLRKMDTSLSSLILFDVEHWVNMAKSHNASLQYYSNQKKVAMYDVKMAKSQFVPTIDLNAGYSVSDTNNYLQNPETEYSYVAASINIPLYNGGGTVSKVRESKEYQYKAASDYRKRFLEIKSKISETFQTMKNLLSEIKSLRSLIESYEIAVESHKKGVKAGISTIVDVVDATNKLYNAKLDLNRAKYEFFLNYVYLKYYSGTISKNDVELLDSYFSQKCSEVGVE